LSCEPSSGHAVHALSHVLYETGQHDHGRIWLDHWVAQSGRSASHRAHFSWHAALHELALHELTSLLEAIRDNQRQQLERQSEALALQREQFALVQRQFERTEKIQDRAEAIQAKSAQIVNVARRMVVIAVPVLVVLIAYVTWLLFRR